MNVIDMPGEIGIVPDLMLPEAPLPQAGLAGSRTGSGDVLYTEFLAAFPRYISLNL